MKKLSIDDKLALNIFHPNEEEPHITVDLGSTDMDEIKKLLLACPAAKRHTRAWTSPPCRLKSKKQSPMLPTTWTS